MLKEIDESAGKLSYSWMNCTPLLAPAQSEGSVRSNMLKPALARGTLHAIGATTLKEYQKYIEKDAAWECRFQPVMVNEPSRDDAIAILRGIKEKMRFITASALPIRPF